MYSTSYSLGIQRYDIQTNIILLAKSLYVYANSSSSLTTSAYAIKTVTHREHVHQLYLLQ